MPDYAGYGNDKLKPLAVQGNEQAIDELEARGNFLNTNDQLVKTTTNTIVNRSDRGELLSTDVVVRTVIDGTLTSITVNGNEQEIRPTGFNG